LRPVEDSVGPILVGKGEKIPKVPPLTSRKLAYGLQTVVIEWYLTADHSIKYRK
jgi:hypothetical protein